MSCQACASFRATLTAKQEERKAMLLARRLKRLGRSRPGVGSTEGLSDEGQTEGGTTGGTGGTGMQKLVQARLRRMRSRSQPRRRRSKSGGRRKSGKRGSRRCKKYGTVDNGHRTRSGKLRCRKHPKRSGGGRRRKSRRRSKSAGRRRSGKRGSRRGSRRCKKYGTVDNGHRTRSGKLRCRKHPKRSGGGRRRRSRSGGRKKAPEDTQSDRMIAMLEQLRELPGASTTSTSGPPPSRPLLGSPGSGPPGRVRLRPAGLPSVVVHPARDSPFVSSDVPLIPQSQAEPEDVV